MTTFGAALFAGGKSRRMGRDKAGLTLDGESFLHRITRELAHFDERLLSIDRPDRYAQLPWEHVLDDPPNCGPLGGLCAVLDRCQSDALLVTTCDLPLYDSQFGAWLCFNLEEPWDAVVPKTPDGIHPLCAVYRKRCLPAFKHQLTIGDYRIHKALDLIQVRYVDAADKKEILCNINTPEEYQGLLQQGKEQYK